MIQGEKKIVKIEKIILVFDSKIVNQNFVI